MKRARFTEEQIIGVLREHEAGARTVDLARKHGVSEATLYNWKTKYGGLEVSEAKRLKQLEDENAKLKKLLAEQMLDAAALRELLSKNGRARRQARRRRAPAGRDGPVGAAGLFDRQRGSQDDPLPVMPTAGHRASDAAARSRQRTEALRLSATFVLLRQNGEPSGTTGSTGSTAKRASGRASDGRGGAHWGRARRSRRGGANARWSLDFVHDQLAAAGDFGSSTSSTT